MADEVPRPQLTVPDSGSPQPEEVVQPQRVVTADDPTIQRFDDGSSIQTFDDGSTLVTDSEGGISSTEAPTSTLRGISGQINRTQAAATSQDAQNAALTSDWRVKLSLAPGAQYLYKANEKNLGILAPLADTDGVIFPYTPSISIQYAAHYDGTELTHSNYKIFQYKNSSVDSITITCDFTAQDTKEANYLLAVIHFLRSVTKMFYGQDTKPAAGTPPPLCYLTGLGQFQFKNHPLVITNFTYSLPNDVDYIRATPFTNTSPGVVNPPQPNYDFQMSRAEANGVPPAGVKRPATFTSPGQFRSGTQEPTYVPTRIQISISASPIVTRSDISNTFSVEQYATGALLNRPSGGGIW